MIDAHAHLQAEAFEPDLPDVLERAAAAGVHGIVVPGWDVPSSRAAVALCRAKRPRQHPRLHPAVGIHPHAAATATEEGWTAIEQMAADPTVVAIGETGLDYDRMFSPRSEQLAGLRRHMDLARVTGKPLVLHCRSASGRRDAQDELLRELEIAGAGGPTWTAAFGGRPIGVLHSFSGPVEYGERALTVGLAVSFSGLVFRGGQEASTAMAVRVPADRLLVETDAPFLPPRGAPRRRNEPAFVRLTAGWLAERRGTDPAALAADLGSAFAILFLRAGAHEVRPADPGSGPSGENDG